MITQIYKFLRWLFFLVFIIISIYASKFYEGSTLFFLIYCFLLVIMVFYLTDKKSSYFEIFLSCYIFLGFWFKFIFSLILYDGYVYDSINIKAANIDDVLLMVIIISFTCIISSFIYKQLINNFNNKPSFALQKSFFEKLYLNNRKLILFSFMTLVLVTGLINIKYGFYQRGFISLIDFPIFYQNLLKWLTMFGFTTLSCFFIYVEISNLKKINFFTVLISFIEIFISYSSMLSRSFIINCISLIVPIYQKSLSFKKKIDNFFYLFFLIILSLTILSIFSVNQIRLIKLDNIKKDWKLINDINYKHNNLIKDSKNKENLKNNEKKSKIIQDFNFQIKSSDNKKKITSNEVSGFILVNRWIGIDSLMLVYFSGKNNFNLFFDALKEKKISGTKNTFYETTFGLSEHKINIGTNKNILKGNTLPGFITFLYYTGNLFFVCIMLFLIIIIFNYFEMCIKKISLGNTIFACFISNLIATRLIHFGYAPKDSYLFILSIIFAVLLMYILSRYNNHFFNKK